MANEIRELIKQRKKNEMLEVLFNVASEELSKRDGEIAELREVLQKISRVSQRTPELNDDYTHEDVGILNDRIDEVFGFVETAITRHK